jgi:hypothetical protein
VRKEPDWTAFWSVTADLPAAGYRELARAAGVHIFNDQDDVLYANASLICLHARNEGRRVLRLPVKVRVRDVLSGAPMAAGVETWEMHLKQGETRLIHWRAS